MLLKHCLSVAALACAAGFAAPAISGAAAAKDVGLVARWTFDDAGVVKNAVADRFHAKVPGKLKTVPGLFGNAVELGGEKTTFSVAPDVIPADIREFTFSAWVAPRTLDGHGNIFRKEDGDNRLLFSFQEGKFLSLGINCGGNYAELDALVSPQELVDGKWHHIAGTFADSDKVMRVFLDGREIGTFPRQTRLNTAHDFVQGWHRSQGNAPGRALAIGSLDGSNEVFQGKLDDARFYSRALPAAEIAKLFAEGGTAAAAPLAVAQPPKAETFTAAIAELDAAVGGKTLTPTEALALHRALNGKFPVEVNDYVLKWQHSPLDNVLADQAGRRATAGRVKDNAFEYMPLAQHQWDVLNAGDRALWTKAKALREKLNSATAHIAADDVFFLEDLFQVRPLRHEAVARHVNPSTPTTQDRSDTEARAVLERDWLFQCDNKPTLARSLQEIGWARQVAERITQRSSGENKSSAAQTAAVTAALAKLAALEKQVLAKQGADKSAAAQDSSLYFAVREAKRQIIFANPVLDFDSVLYIDNPYPSGREWQHETRHYLGYMAVPGGRLLVQKGLGPDGKFTQIAPTAPLHGTFWRPDLSYDAKRVLFSFKPHNEKTFHLYEAGLDGSGFRQLSSGMFDDFDPIYLPDGKNIMFTTTRGYLYVRCMPPTNAMVTAKMPLDTKPGDKNLYIISRNGEPEYTPSVMGDGRVLFTRWEYTDKPLWRAQKLWTMGQNGELVQTFWGNQSVWPDLMKDARSIPGSKRVMFTGSAHHNWFAGSIGIIDPAQGLNFPHGLTKVTQEVHWPECGNGPTDPKENTTYHVSGHYRSYYSPYPLSEKEFLVSAQRNGKFVLLFMDTDGNREIINEGAHNIWDAVPIRKRPVPPPQPDKLDWPTWENRDNPATGTIYSNNVYEGAPPELRDKARFLRIWSIEHKTYTYWFKRPHLSTGPELSANQSEGVKRIIGTVPIEADGSVNFTAPSGVALHFQLLDEKQRALQTMKSFTGVQPGEMRGCFGCHEMHMNSAQGPTIGKAMRRKPSEITPVPWKDITVGYERYVQEGINEYCGKCHEKEGNKAQKAFDSKLRPGFLGFKEPYMTLMGNPTWGSPYHNKKGTGAFGWADTILVESYSTVDPRAYVTYPPMKKLSYASRLVKRFAGEKVYPGDNHPKIEADAETLLRVKLWVDAMGPYSGVEELRAKEDPTFFGKGWISQPPRIKTAPVVTRPGPFDPFDTANDPAYAPPKPEQFNALPPGVKRRAGAATTSEKPLPRKTASVYP